MRYFFGLVLSHALGYVAAPLAKPEREHLADQLVRERDEVVQRGVGRADLAAVRETAEGQELQESEIDDLIQFSNLRESGAARRGSVWLLGQEYIFISKFGLRPPRGSSNKLDQIVRASGL